MKFLCVLTAFVVLVLFFMAGCVSMLSHIKENYPAAYLLMRYERKCPAVIEIIRKALQEWAEGKL